MHLAAKLEVTGVWATGSESSTACGLPWTGHSTQPWLHKVTTPQPTRGIADEVRVSSAFVASQPHVRSHYMTRLHAFFTRRSQRSAWGMARHNETVSLLQQALP